MLSRAHLPLTEGHITLESGFGRVQNPARASTMMYRGGTYTGGVYVPTKKYVVTSLWLNLLRLNLLGLYHHMRLQKMIHQLFTNTAHHI